MECHRVYEAITRINNCKLFYKSPKYCEITQLTTLPETNSQFAPENGWLEYKPFLLGPSAYFQVRFQTRR